MSENDQTHFKNLAANAGKFLKYVLSFWDIMYLRAQTEKSQVTVNPSGKIALLIRKCSYFIKSLIHSFPMHLSLPPKISENHKVL